MAQKRRSARLHAKRQHSPHQTSDEQKINQIRLSYNNDIPNAEIAFVRLNQPNHNLNDEEIGVIEIASLPTQIGMYNWSVTSIFFECDTTNEINGFNAVNDDNQYKQYLLSLSENEWPEQEEFWDEWGIAGKPVKAIYNEAYKNGKKDGRHQVLILLVHQILIYLCIKMSSYLKEDISKRGATQKAYEHLPVFAWKDKGHNIGHNILSSLAGTYEQHGYMHHYNTIDWDTLVEIVGIENVAKKISQNLYYYGDIAKITWNESNQLIVMHFVPVRWDGDKHRHRNVPVLLDNE